MAYLIPAVQKIKTDLSAIQLVIKKRGKKKSRIMKPQLHSTSVTLRNPPFKSKAPAFRARKLQQVREDVAVLDGVATATVQYSADRSDACVGTK